MKTTRPAVLLAAVFAVAGCGQPPAPSAKDDKGGPGPAVAPPANIPSGPVAPNADSSVAAGKFVGDLLSTSADPNKLSPAFLKVVGKPVLSADDKAKGYNPSTAQGWLNRVGAALTQIGPPAGFTAANSAVFTGPNGGGRYLVRMTQADGSWKVDYFSLGTATENKVETPKTADEAFQDFAVLGFLHAATSTALPREDRVPLAAALLSAKFRADRVGPVADDADQGFDYNRGKLGNILDGLGQGATALSRTRTGADTFRAEITRGGAAKAYTVKLVRDPAGGWLIDDVTGE